MRFLFALVATFFVLGAAPDSGAADGRIVVVAAENFYADVARQIGGDRVAVTGILNNPDQDPHLFETTAATIRPIAAAQIVIYNGAAYDPWMDALLRVTRNPQRVAIVAADLVHARAGDDPHLWYNPATMPAVAAALAAALGAADAAHKDDYASRLAAFLSSLEPLHAKIAGIRSKYGGAAVTASEPVFDYMAAALDLSMRNQRFALAIMNDTEPSARDLAHFEDDLKTRSVRVMFFNTQAVNRIVEHLVDLARASGVAVVGVNETAPPGMSYQQWMLNELDQTERALAGASS